MLPQVDPQARKGLFFLKGFMILLFVYGTLKSDGAANDFMEGRLLGSATTEPGFRLYTAGWYPCMVPDAGGIAVEGELWEVPRASLPNLDRHEGSGFQRTPIRLQAPHAEKSVLAYLYKGRVAGLDEVGPCWDNNGHNCNNH